jgi:hypothetical protein
MSDTVELLQAQQEATVSALNAGVQYVLAATRPPDDSVELNRASVYAQGVLADDLDEFVKEAAELDVYLRWVKRAAPKLYERVRRV